MSKTAVKTCFVIGPIGDPGTSTRNNADWLLKGIIQPIMKEDLNFKVQRADEIARPGMIDSQVINAVIDADLVIADLSEDNPNAFYELAIRHMEGRPVIHMTRESKIPFDVQPYRTIKFSTASPDDVEKAKSELKTQVNEALYPNHEVDNPITTARGKKKWQETATTKEKVIMDVINGLVHNMNSLTNRVTETERALRPPTNVLSLLARSAYFTPTTSGETPLTLRAPEGKAAQVGEGAFAGGGGLSWSQTVSHGPPNESG